MAHQVNLGWTRNGATPIFDQGNKGGGRPTGGGDPGVGQAVYNAILANATHYVDPEKTTDGAGTEADPWQPSQAKTSAVGGDVVVIEAGLLVGTDPGGNYVTESGFRPVNAGTSENPITFIARNAAVYSGGIGNTEIRSGATVQASGWGAFGSNSEYVNFYGFYSDNNAANNKAFDDAGTVVIRLAANGCKIGWCDLRGQSGQSNNYSAVRVETSDEVEIFSSRMQGYTGNTNNSGVILYKCNRTKIHNCEIFNCTHGIQPKGAEGDGSDAIWGFEIYQNVIRDCSQGLRLHGPVKGPSGEIALIYQNIVYSCSQSIEFTSSNTNIGEQDGLRIFNNVLESSGNDPASLWVSQNYTGEGVIPRDNIFFNNIIRGQHYIGSYDDQDLSRSVQFFTNFTTSNRNIIDISGSVLNGSTASGIDDVTITQWRTAGMDQDSAFESPTFVDAENRDYHLDGTQTASTIGRDTLGQFGTVDSIIPAGAYVTGDETIGVAA